MEDNEYLNGFLLLKKYGFSYEDTVKIMDDCSFNRIDDSNLGTIIDNGCRYLLNKGYNAEEIRKMAKLSSRCLVVSDSKRYIVENAFLDLGMTIEEFRMMSLKCANLYSYSKERIDDYINFFRNLGYSDKDIANIFKKTLNIFRSSVVNLKKLYEDMKEFGFTHEVIVGIGRSFPGFWTHNFIKINGIVNTFIRLGFSKEQAMVMLRKSPSLLGYSEDTVLEKFGELIELGFSREELIRIILVYPTLINADINRTKEIIEFFNDIGLYDKLLMDPKGFFMQGIETSYARYYFYMDRNIEINEDNYCRLFRGWKSFEKVYGINKKELLERYPYKGNYIKCKKK